jgi:hypothetical protein
MVLKLEITTGYISLEALESWEWYGTYLQQGTSYLPRL